MDSTGSQLPEGYYFLKINNARERREIREKYKGNLKERTTWET
jgi:hypothetical protein